MTIQHTDADGLSVMARPAPQVWYPGTPEDGLDARLELARLAGAGSRDAGTTSSPADDGSTGSAGSAGEGRVAVRDARYPGGPVLLFSLPDWDALLGRRPDLVDLR